MDEQIIAKTNKLYPIKLAAYEAKKSKFKVHILDKIRLIEVCTTIKNRCIQNEWTMRFSAYMTFGTIRVFNMMYERLEEYTFRL